MMTPDEIEKAAEILLRHRLEGTKSAGLPPDIRPDDRAEGYRVAEAIARQSDDRVVGWKIAATSEAGQRHINVSGPLAGRILAGHLVPPGGVIPFAGNIMRVAEGEFAFVFAEDLPPRDVDYSQAAVMRAVATLHPCVETPDSRFAVFTEAGEPQLAADTACAGRFVLGPAVTAPWRDIDLAAHRVTMRKNGAEAGSGTGQAVLGDPRFALTWLVNEVGRYGGGIRAGDFVTTGTCIKPVPVEPGDRIDVDYGILGTLAARIG